MIASLFEHWLFAETIPETTAERICLLLAGRPELNDPVEAAACVDSVVSDGPKANAIWSHKQAGRVHTGRRYSSQFELTLSHENGLPVFRGACECGTGLVCRHLVGGLLRLSMDAVPGLQELFENGGLKQYIASPAAARTLLRFHFAWHDVAHEAQDVERADASAANNEAADCLANEAQDAEEADTRATKAHLLFALKGEKDGTGSQLLLRGVTPLKRGGLSTKEVSFLWSAAEEITRGKAGGGDLMSGESVWRFVSNLVDIPIARHLLLAGASPHAEELDLHGRKLARAFDLMVRSGRLRVLTQYECAIGIGEAREAKPVWRRQGDGLWALGAEVANGGMFVPIDPPWYVSSKDGVAGPVSTTWGRGALQMLRAGNSLTEADLEVVSARMEGCKHAATLDVPMPPRIEVVDGGVVQPKPVLMLSWTPIDPAFEGRRARFGNSGGKAEAKLRFDYDGVVVDGSGPERLAKWNGTKQIIYTRDREFEEQCWRLITPDWVKDEQRTHGHVPYGNVDYFDEEAIGRLLSFQSEVVPKLHLAGWTVGLSALWPGRFIKATKFEAVQGEPEKGWLDFEMTAEIDGRKVDMLALITKAMDDEGLLASLTDPAKQEMLWEFTQASGYVVQMSVKELAGLLALGKSLSKDSKSGRYRISKYDIGALQEAERATDTRMLSSPGIAELVQAISDVPMALPDHVVKAMAKPAWESQVFGAGWCGVRRRFGLGGIIADEYAVGKTCQTLITMFDASHEVNGVGRPSLVVVTKTLFYERRWQEDAVKFLPGMSLLQIATTKATSVLKQASDYTVVIATYDVVCNHLPQFQAIHWNVIGCDEAHRLGNSSTNGYKAILSLEARQKLMITGSPMQNTPREMWSLMNLCVPGLLRDKSWFNKTFPKLKAMPSTADVNDGEEAEDQSQAEFANRARLMCLGTLIGPFQLRRTNHGLGRVLPPIVFIDKELALPNWQANIYEGIRVAKKSEVMRVVHENGLHQSKLHIFSLMLQMRQACCDPRLLKYSSTAVRESQPAKVAAILELCRELVADGKRVVIVSEWTEWLALLKGDLAGVGIQSSTVSGLVKSGKKRKVQSELFRSGANPVMLLQLTLGEGIELPEADVMISCEPWWNEAKLSQCIARMRRDERNKTVTLIRLRIGNSVETGVQRVADRKLADTDAVNEGHAKGSKALTMDDIEAFFSIPDREED